MNSKQMILIFITFFIMILGLSIPLWLDRGLPILKDFLNSSIDTLEKGYEFLKFFIGILQVFSCEFTKSLYLALINFTVAPGGMGFAIFEKIHAVCWAQSSLPPDPPN